VKLTEKGKSVTSELFDTIARTVDEISLNNMDEDRRTEFYRSLRTLANSISEAVKEI